MGPVISTDEALRLLSGGSPPVMLDVRWRLTGPSGRADHEAGHLPGAVFVDLDNELADPAGSGGRHPLPNPTALQESLRAAGVCAGRPVLVYDADNGSVAARAWWLLRWAGHEHVRVLDGGYAAWVSEQRPVSTDQPSPERGDFEVVGGHMPVVELDRVGSLAREGTLLDARAPERYRGETEPIDPRAGHVPGAVNAPFTGHIDEYGRWRSPEELADRFRALGVDESRPVAAYCGSGVTACSVLLAWEQAGLSREGDRPALFPGSWSQWSSDPGRPAATGAEPG
ncbi:sulfurtransferase [Allosaccharopolyspora coralli]|uniref:Sulfurtransferase n=1 Tax=Allosaccharopolyspora coralli TaxID=2665642 RepID=A0A5Q3QDA4_9PSEU|nr:sulfurtransferase [Allosaccharopolyspora coralli]QGK69465.1 sulfurtransferase [Allosaccharopolyspora coralli]